MANTLVPPRSLLWLSKDFALPLVPAGLLRALRERTLARAFSGVPSVPQVDQVFWRDYQHGLVSRLSKAELLSMYRVGIDLIELPIRAGRPCLLAGEGPYPGVGRGHPDAGAASRAQAVLPKSRGAHVPRRGTYAVDEP